MTSHRYPIPAGEIIDKQFAADVTLELRFALDALPRFEHELGELSAGRATLVGLD